MMRYLKTLNDVQRYYCKLFKHKKFLIERNEVISYGDFDQLVTKIEKMTIPVSKAKYDILKEFEQPIPYCTFNWKQIYLLECIVIRSHGRDHPSGCMYIP